MPLIKRYPNRKLYDTEAKQYITLEGIADMIRQGEDVRVIDHSTGEDLTALTLTQIIFEQEKKQSGFLPLSVLSGLVQAGGHRFSSLQRTLASSLGFWHQIDEEIRRRVQLLIKEGEISEGEGVSLLEKLTRHSHAQEADFFEEKQVEQAIAERNLPSRSDLKRLYSQLDALSARLDEMQGNAPELDNHTSGS